MSEQTWHHILKILRKGSGLRQEDVAKHLGVARTTYLYMESGTRPPYDDELLKLSELYQIPADEIFGVEITRRPTPELHKSWLSVTGAEAQLLKHVRAEDLHGAMDCLLNMIKGT